MAFDLQGGSAASNDYDYQSGSGMDGFMSRSIDEVSWQSTLGSYYTTLGTLPIGQMQTTATPTNYDATQVSGSVGGAITVGGGSTNGSGGGSAGSIVIDGINGAISILDQNGNTVGILGNLNG
jgi:hypothetical protein